MPTLVLNDRRRTYIKPRSPLKVQVLHELMSSESEDEISEDDMKKDDPDWRKTPLFKKIRQITVSLSLTYIYLSLSLIPSLWSGSGTYKLLSLLHILNLWS